MGVVSFRLSDEDETLLRRAGVVPGALAKDLVERRLRELHVEVLRKKNERVSGRLGVPLVEVVRQMRDEE